MSASDLISVHELEGGGALGKSGSGQEKMDSPMSEDGGLHLEQLVKEIEWECGLERSNDKVCLVDGESVCVTWRVEVGVSPGE